MFSSFVLVAYFSPETLLPATSIIATIAGVALMCGRGVLRFLVRVCRRRVLAPGRLTNVSQPHFRIAKKAGSESPTR